MHWSRRSDIEYACEECGSPCDLESGYHVLVEADESNWEEITDIKCRECFNKLMEKWLARAKQIIKDYEHIAP